VTRQAAAASRPGSGRPPGRRPGDSGTREAILAAARACFAEVGYDRATIRRIAADAGVDPALVHHYFGRKERLFAAAMRLPVAPTDVLEGVLGSHDQGDDLGQHLIRALLAAWGLAEVREAFLGLLRTAVTNDDAAALMREFATEAILGRVAKVVRDRESAAPAGEAEFRAALVGSQVLGLALTRYVLQLGALTAATDERLAAAIGPALDRYLTGDLPGNDRGTS
jgi:AcrR family transcriptional regulator